MRPAYSRGFAGGKRDSVAAAAPNILYACGKRVAAGADSRPIGIRNFPSVMLTFQDHFCQAGRWQRRQFLRAGTLATVQDSVVAARARAGG